MSLVETQVEFLSEGTICRGLFVRPQTSERAPLIILSHGLGGIYEMRLDAFARRFAEAGYAALTFDYRYFGRSDGHPRHWLVRERQQQDIEAAIAFGKTLDGVDPQRVVLWGTSLGGGHMIDVSSRRTDIAATIIQGPFTDGFASGLAISLPSVLGVVLFATADGLARLFRRPPVLTPLAGTFGTPALMTAPDVVQDVLLLLPSGSALSARLTRLFELFAKKRVKLTSNIVTSDKPEQFPISAFTGSIILPSGTSLINGVSASFGLKIIFWRPGRNLKRVHAPVLVCVCEGDTVAPPKPTVKYARAAPLGETKVYPFRHFEIYTGEPFELMVKDQLEFLSRHVPTATASLR